MKRKKLWITLSLVNLYIVALLGLSLRTKFLFPIAFIDYKYFLSAHSHFAFGGWVTLAFMILYIDKLLVEEQKQKPIYQWILWGIEITSFGMAITFPFQGYAFLSIVFSTVFIFFTYLFAGVFIKDLLKTKKEKPVRLLSIAALVSLVVSSVGPFTLAYILATNTGDAILYRDSIYTYLHFQYNGFFTLSVFSLFLNQLLPNINADTKKRIRQFAFILCLSIIPALFLSLLWHFYNIYIRGLAMIGCILIILSLISFCTFAFSKKIYSLYGLRLARTLLIFSMISFFIKMILQTGTIFPKLGNAVFGYRPIIIGFLHLVFLGFVTFYILSAYLDSAFFDVKKRLTTIAIIIFSTAVFINETILLVNGIGLLFYYTNYIYYWLLWGAALLLFTGALLILFARLASESKKAIV